MKKKMYYNMRFKNISRQLHDFKKTLKNVKNIKNHISHSHLMNKYLTLDKKTQVKEIKEYSNYMHSCYKAINKEIDLQLQF